MKPSSIYSYESTLKRPYKILIKEYGVKEDDKSTSISKDGKRKARPVGNITIEIQKFIYRVVFQHTGLLEQYFCDKSVLLTAGE